MLSFVVPGNSAHGDGLACIPCGRGCASFGSTGSAVCGEKYI